MLVRAEIRCGALVPRVPRPAAGGFPGQAAPAARAVGGSCHRSSIPGFPARGDEFTRFAPSWGVWRCCRGVPALQQACSCRCLPSPAAFPVAITLVLHCSYTKPNQQFYFHFPTPDFSAEKYPFCCLAGKQKLGLCREDGDGGQLQTPLLAPPPLNSDSFHQHVFIVLQADE